MTGAASATAHDAELRAAWQLAAWAPDAARDRLAALLEAGSDDDALLASASEVLGKVFAVTGAWALAAQAYEQAAAVHDTLGHPALAGALREVFARFPLAPFADDGEALAAELAVIEAAQRGTAVAAERRIAELRRALPPRPITGRLEAAFALGPEEMSLLMAAIAGGIDPLRYPARSTAEWSALLGGGGGGGTSRGALDDRRLLAIGLCRGGLALVPHPGVVSRLRGRDRLESPPGLRLRAVAPAAAPERADELAAALVGPALGVIHGPGPRAAVAAAIAARLGWQLYLAHPRLGANQEQVEDAIIEATLFGGLLALELDRWRRLGIDPVRDGGAALARRGPLLVLAAGDPAIAPRHRAFTIGLGAVRSPR
ncbi:MAG TPA: hypothetical protein VNO30_15155 [Kofleriaceae bacterium]|nr:hypothetical protein [Kofleriaceae bacterium]